jgi:hypothetical protein
MKQLETCDYCGHLKASHKHGTGECTDGIFCDCERFVPKSIIIEKFINDLPPKIIFDIYDYLQPTTDEIEYVTHPEGNCDPIEVMREIIINKILKTGN